MDEDDDSLAIMVRTLEGQAHLEPADRDALLALPVTVRALAAGAYLIREGDTPSHCAVLLSGYAFRQKLSADGGRQILSLHIPGDMLDLQNLFLDVSDHNVQTLNPVRVALIPRAALADLFYARHAIGKALLLSLLIEASIAREWLLNIGRRDARERLAHFLCELATRLNLQNPAGGTTYELPMTQEQLGDVLGLTPVHVNRTLRALEAQGCIVRTNRTIAFPEWARLREIADFSDRYLHLKQQA